MLHHHMEEVFPGTVQSAVPLNPGRHYEVAVVVIVICPSFLPHLPPLLADTLIDRWDR